MRMLLVTLSLLSLFAPNESSAVQDMGFASHLPGETSLYVTTENLSEVASAISQSNFYKAFYEVPAIREASERGEFPNLVAKWNEMTAGEQGPLIRAAASLLGEEVIFATTCEGSRGLFPGVLQMVRIVLLAQEYKMGGMDNQVAERLAEASAGLEGRLGLESLVLAFKSDRKEILAPMIDGILTQLPPEISPMVLSEEVKGVPFTTLSLVPAMFFPPDQLQAVLASAIPDSSTVQAVATVYSSLLLKARLGWIDNYLVLVVEDDKGKLAVQLADGPGRESLADMKEFRSLLDRVGDRSLRRAVLNQVNWRKNAGIQLSELAEDLKMCRTLMGFAAMAGVTADIVCEKIGDFVDKVFDPLLAVGAVELDQGLKVSADLYWAPGSKHVMEGSMKLETGKMIPASALGWAVWGGPNAAEQCRMGLNEAIKWRSMPWVTMSMPDEQRAVQGKITDLMEITRDHLPDAIGDEGMVVLGWNGELRSIKDQELNLLIPELALAFQITDMGKIKELAGLSEAKILEIMAQSGDTAATIPKPVTKKVNDGECYTWEGVIPAEGSGLKPTVYLTRNHLVISSSSTLAEELYETCRSKGKTRDWPAEELEQLIKGNTSQAGVLLTAEVLDRMGPFLNVLMGMKCEESGEDADIEKAKANLDPILNLAKVIRQFWFHMTNESGVGHVIARIEIEDLP